MNSLTIEIIDLDFAMIKPIATAQGKISRRKGQEVYLTDGGLTGVGEVLPLPNWSKSSYLETKDELRAIQLNPKEALGNVQKFSPEVQAGLGTAMWAHRAAQSDQQLYEALGGNTNRVFVNALVGGGSEIELRSSIKNALEQGYETLKVKMGFGSTEDQKRLQIIAAEIAQETKVRLDANGAWTQQEALDLTQLAFKFLGERLEYVEDPVSTVEELCEIRPALTVDIAADALIGGSQDIEHMIFEGGASFIILKPTLLGGIDPVLVLSKQVRKLGAYPVLSSVYDGPVGLCTWCHLAAAVSPGITHGLGTAELIDDSRMESLIPRNGFIELPNF
tara:strand:+ start:258 stop:1259 length:1002 start_codon:yes stop_codon:yes gene_type:complete